MNDDLMDKLALEFYQQAKIDIVDLLMETRARFDDSEYQQGVKDGLRKTLALLGSPERISFNRKVENEDRLE